MSTPQSPSSIRYTWLLISLLMLSTLFCTSCATFRSKEPEPELFHRPTGIIQKVDPHQHFVLFESSFRFRPDQQAFAVRDGRRVARLRVHSQSRPPFYVADILEGQPAINDLIE